MFRRPLVPSRPERTAWCVWLTLFLLLSADICLGANVTVRHNYAHAAERWINGEPLYNGVGSGFVYLPQAAILHVPFALLPRIPGEILWRALTIGVYALGLRRLCSLSDQNRHARLFPLATCVVVPLAFAAARNGQATLLVAGLVMLAIDKFIHGHWSRAAALLCLSVAFKPLTLPFLLVIGTVYRPMSGRLALGVLLVGIAPYLAQDWRFVTQQYLDCAASLRTTAEVGMAAPWAQFFGLIETAGFAVPALIQGVVRTIGAGGTLVVIWFSQRSLSPARNAIYLFALTTCSLLLLNPRTENNTYAFLAPAIGLFCAEAFLTLRSRRLGVLVTLIALGMLGGYEVSTLVAPRTAPIWLTPLMAVCFLAIVIVRLLGELKLEARAHFPLKSRIAFSSKVA